MKFSKIASYNNGSLGRLGSGEGGGSFGNNYISILKSCVFFSFSVLTDGLKDNFGNVEVNVLECPDLRQPPFHLAAEGIYEPTSYHTYA